MMYSAQKLDNQGENIQPYHTPFPILNQSVVVCKILTVAPWPIHKFLRRQVRWSGILISLRKCVPAIYLKKRNKAFLLISTISLVFSWINNLLEDSEVFPGGSSGKTTHLQYRRHKRQGFNRWVGKIPRRRKWQPILVFLPGESHG